MHTYLKPVALMTVSCLCLTLAMMQHVRAEVILKGVDDLPAVKEYLETIAGQRVGAKGLTDIEADILRGLKAKGYYDARVDGEIANDRSVFSIHAGDVYTIDKIHLNNVPDDLNVTIHEGDALDAEMVLTAQKQLFQNIRQDFCYYNLDVQHQITLDHSNKTAEVYFNVMGQDGARFGATTFIGAENIERSYLDNFVTYKDGDCWKSDNLEDTKAALYATGLLASAEATIPEKLPDDGIVPIVFQVKDRAFKSVKLGAGYNTSDGAGVIAEWEHRNILGAGEKLSLKAKLYEIVQNLSATFNKPFFLRDDQSLSLEALLTNEDNDAYKELSHNISGTVSRDLTRELSLSLGAGYEITTIEDEEGERTYGLWYTPVTLVYDSRDDMFDPHKGWNASLKFTPFFDTLGEADPFFKSRATVSTYFDLSDSTIDPVLALRASYGFISGSDSIDVPASKRFYAGGGGSVRGFGYQEVGPKDDDGDPSGGLSLVETTAEMRFRLGQNIGMVTFLDAGQVYDDTLPDFSGDMAVGAGVGLRYYTDFGPLRFDVAVPVNQKNESDSSYQIYLSIGQAF